MKLLLFLLSFYLLALPAMPCNDVHEENKILSVANQQNDHTDEDVCNPFCICTCCNIAVDVQQVLQITALPSALSLFYHNHFTAALQEQPNNCWQPPKTV